MTKACAADSSSACTLPLAKAADSPTTSPSSTPTRISSARKSFHLRRHIHRQDRNQRHLQRQFTVPRFRPGPRDSATRPRPPSTPPGWSTTSSIKTSVACPQLRLLAVLKVQRRQRRQDHSRPLPLGGPDRSVFRRRLHPRRSRLRRRWSHCTIRCRLLAIRRSLTEGNGQRRCHRRGRRATCTVQPPSACSSAPRN